MYRIGIDLGGTNIAAGLVDEKLQLLELCSVKTNAPRPEKAIAADMVKLIHMLLKRRGLTLKDLAYVGVGVPCTVNRANGHLQDANNLGFDDSDLLGILSDRLGLPVHGANDADAAAWAEYLLGGYEADSFLMMTVGTGIGGGIILHDHLWPGHNGAAGEIGHMVIDLDGAPCTCGRQGCFEAMASASALAGQARAYMQRDPDTLMWQLCGGSLEAVEAKTVFDAAREADAAAIRLLDRYTDYLAQGIANIINIFQPEVLCIGGGVSRAGDALLLLPLRRKVAGLIYSKHSGQNTKIQLAKLSNEAGVLGAALLGVSRRQIYESTL